jgi:hypothetical protein
MKPTWADILPRVSEPTEFKLATEDPRDADEEVATTDWPLDGVSLPPRPTSIVLVEPQGTPSLWARLSGVFR